MLRPADLLISSTLLLGVGLLTLLGFAQWGAGTGTNEDAVAVAQTVIETPVAIASDTPSPPELPGGLTTPTIEVPVFLSQPQELLPELVEPAEASQPECRYWNVLRPVDDSLSSFWIGGWVEECDGVMGPVVSLGSGESIEEVYLRLENAVAQINQLQNQINALSETPVVE